jgi:hypothetical protein
MTSTHTRIWRIAPLLLLLLVCAGSTGCSTSASLSRWRDAVESYVKDEGGGDPSVLKEVTIDRSSTTRGFALLGGDRATESTDARGLLLAHRPINGQLWFVYLVGLVQNQKTTDIRLAAMHAEGGKYTWRTSKEDESALKRYNQYTEHLAAERLGKRDAAPPVYTTFPRPEDAFDLNVDGSVISATHRGSGARWQVALGK